MARESEQDITYQYGFEAGYRAGREAGRRELRDLFAAAALEAIVSKDNSAIGWANNVARDAYAYADAMMKVREEKP